MTDDLGDETFLVAGARDPSSTGSKAAVWKVTTDCDTELIAELGEDTWALDVTGGFSDWQAVGRDYTDGRPITWTGSGPDDFQFLHDDLGNAFVINSDGHIVGWRRHKRNNVAVLWVR